MKLREALASCEVLGSIPDVEIHGLDYDSRRVGPGFAFFPFLGENFDGHAFIPAARKAGAVAVVSERPQPEDDPGGWVQVRHGRRAGFCGRAGGFGEFFGLAAAGRARAEDDIMAEEFEPRGSGRPRRCR